MRKEVEVYRRVFLLYIGLWLLLPSSAASLVGIMSSVASYIGLNKDL